MRVEPQFAARSSMSMPKRLLAGTLLSTAIMLGPASTVQADVGNTPAAPHVEKPEKIKPQSSEDPPWFGLVRTGVIIVTSAVVTAAMVLRQRKKNQHS